MEKTISKLKSVKETGIPWLIQEADGENPEVEVSFGWEGYEVSDEESTTHHQEWVVTVGGEVGISSSDRSEVAKYIRKFKRHKVAEVIESRENFPTDGESFIVGRTEDGKFFFAWGWIFPFAEELPEKEVPDEENGFSYHPNSEKAVKAFSEAIEAE